jgi:two-component system CheB/CheR fusion protein
MFLSVPKEQSMVAKKNKPPTTATKKELKIEQETPLNSTTLEKADFPIVGIGASAGGLAAFEAFFVAMPADKEINMAFVLVQHLAPDHKSILTELLQRHTSMTVLAVEDGVIVKPNHVYIIPPDRDMAFMHGSLQLLKPVIPRGHRFPVDFLFSSLAQDLGEKAIVIILSGTGSDGTLGMREIKAEGGMAIVQSITSAEFSGMPQSAIDTGLVDYVLSPESMAEQLSHYAKYSFVRPRAPIIHPLSSKDNSLKKLFILLRAKTGHDFSEYKQSTIGRRIDRRMAMQQITSLAGYVKYLQQTPEEIEILFNEFLIGVTSMFRDPEAFHEIEKVITAQLFENKRSGDEVKVWICGCSTGEEAYSIAILLQEKLDLLSQKNRPNDFKVQIFASDINSLAIQKARQGFFPEDISRVITPERLGRYFIFDSNTKNYRISTSIREMIIFSEQDVIKDPPFSKLDLISCRNLMIYMQPVLQQKIISLFHYALKTDGFLFLGTSETTGEMSSLFTILDHKQKLYQRKTIGYATKPSVFKSSPPEITTPEQNSPMVLTQGNSLQHLAEKALLQQVIQAGILVNRKGDILYLHGRTGMYLEAVTGGIESYNVLKMAREGLQSELIVALHKAVSDNVIVKRSGLRVKTNGDFRTVNLTVSPLTGSIGEKNGSLMFMLVLETEALKLGTSTEVSTATEKVDVKARIAILEQSVRDKDSFIQSVTEDQQSAFEELKSANEELQSINEELQSTNEELETSKEELQSVNEELASTNCELQGKALESAHLNDDMNNLIVGTGIATIFVDLQLKILRFTPGLAQIISLIDTDIGRHLMHFTSTLKDYNRLEKDLESMLQSLIPNEVEVQTLNGSYYMLRMLPYRTIDNRIVGAVINFINITEHKQAELSLKMANDQLRLATVVRDANDAILLQDMAGNIMAFNTAAQIAYGWSETEALTLNITSLVPEALQKIELNRIKKLSLKESLEAYQTKRLTKDGLVIDVWLTATALLDHDGEVYAIATTERHNKKDLAQRLKS